jgi:DNA-binding NarL/FixJ family response regulator
MKFIKLLIVDDRDIVRDSLKLLFTESTGIKVEGEAVNGEEALKLIKENDYDVVLMDLMMPKVNGIDATKNILKFKPNIKILANSFSINPFYIKQSIEAGACGFIQKDENKSSYIEAIKTIHNGGVFLSEGISNKVYDKVLYYLN